MADEDQDQAEAREPEPSREPESGAGQDGQSIEQRLTRLEELVRRALAGGAAPGGSRAAETEERRREMAEALADLRKQEKADRAMRDLGADVRKLKAEVLEKPPREFRRVELVMGWPDRE